MYENINIKSIAIDITTFCNLNCLHCFNRKDAALGHMSYDSIIEIIDKFSMYGVSEILISGGEPLIHPDIDRIISIPIFYPNISFTIITNCILLTDEFVLKIESIENLFVQFSIDGSRLEVYEKQRGIGSFNDFFNGFLRLTQSSIKCKPSVIVVSKMNYRDVENIYKLLIDHGLLPSFQFVINVGNAKDNWEHLNLNLAQKMYVINMIKKMNLQYGKEIPIPRPASSCEFSDFRERQTLLVRTDGAIVACQALINYPIGNILHDDLPDILRGSVMMRFYEIGNRRYITLDTDTLCVNCGIKENCWYGCLGMALNNNNKYGFDGECAFRKAEASLRMLINSKC